jgi:hypothetical protein
VLILLRTVPALVIVGFCAVLVIALRAESRLRSSCDAQCVAARHDRGEWRTPTCVCLDETPIALAAVED